MYTPNVRSYAMLLYMHLYSVLYKGKCCFAFFLGRLFIREGPLLKVQLNLLVIYSGVLIKNTLF